MAITEFFSSETWMYICNAFPTIASIAMSVFTALFAVHKFVVAIDALKDNSEIQKLRSDLRKLAKDNEQQALINQALVTELKKMYPVGHTDDNNNKGG